MASGGEETWCEISPRLFGNLSGAPAENMFRSTFYDCNNLTGSIPTGLFGKLSGAPAANMFRSTFYDCNNLTGEIPVDLFGDISGDAAEGMFVLTFRGCSKLTGATPLINSTPLYDIWPDATTEQVGGCYQHASGLSDYSQIPLRWR